MPGPDQISPAEFEEIIKDLDPKRPYGFSHRGRTPEAREAAMRMAILEDERTRAKEALAKLSPGPLSESEYEIEITRLKALKEEARRNREAEEVAQAFHETYERLAPDFGYETREKSAVPWAEVPGDNKRLMIATVRLLLDPSKPVICLP